MEASSGIFLSFLLFTLSGVKSPPIGVKTKKKKNTKKSHTTQTLVPQGDPHVTQNCWISIVQVPYVIWEKLK